MTVNGSSNSAEQPETRGRRRPQRPERKARSRRRIAVVWTAVVLALCALAAVWLGARASEARQELSAATELIPRLKAEIVRDDAAAATATVDQLKVHAAKARASTSDPLWSIAGALPWLGSNFRAAQDVAVSADDVARLAAGPLVSVYQSLDWRTLTPGPEGIDLAPLAAAQPAIVDAAQVVGGASDRLDRIDTTALLPQLSQPLTAAREELSSLRGSVEAAADVALVAPDMLGGEAPRNYLLMIQNNAEARASGGIPGALAKLTVDKGRLSLTSQTSAGALGRFSPPLDVDKEQEQIYSERLGAYMQDVNLTPDFPTAADTAHRMWEQKTGEKVDGVISIDPVALGYILDATGPITLADPAFTQPAAGALPTELSGKNVVRTLLSDVYSKIGNPGLQDAYFAGVAEEVFGALSQGTADPKAFVTGVAKAAAERRILLWSAVTPEQSVIGGYPVSGSVTGGSISPGQFGVYFNDGTGAKMDYYVRRTAQLFEECAADGSSQIKLRVTSTNAAPLDAATSLPPYVTGGGVFDVPAGTVQSNTVAYGPAKAQIESVFRDGVKVPFTAQHQAERPVGTVTARLAPGQSTTMEFFFTETAPDLQLKLDLTPSVQPLNDVIRPAQREGCIVTK